MKLINLEFENNSTLQLIADTEEQVNEVIRCFKEQEIIEMVMESGTKYVIDPFNINYISIEEVKE